MKLNLLDLERYEDVEVFERFEKSKNTAETEAATKKASAKAEVKVARLKAKLDRKVNW